jgi:hypothetical protein
VIKQKEFDVMKIVYLIRVIAFFAIATSLGGCGTSYWAGWHGPLSDYRGESQVRRRQGPLSVVVYSDIQCSRSHWSGASTSRVTLSFKEMDDIVVEQQGEETLLYVGKDLRFRIPEETKRLIIKVENSNIAVEADGVLLPKVEDTEPNASGHAAAHRP